MVRAGAGGLMVDGAGDGHRPLLGGLVVDCVSAGAGRRSLLSYGAGTDIERRAGDLLTLPAAEK